MSDDTLEQLIRDGLEAVNPRNTMASGEADGIIDSIRAAIMNARWTAFTDDELAALQEWNASMAEPGLLPDGIRLADERIAIELTAEIERRKTGAT